VFNNITFFTPANRRSHRAQWPLDDPSLARREPRIFAFDRVFLQRPQPWEQPTSRRCSV
jgi:hypothetical protein